MSTTDGTSTHLWSVVDVCTDGAETRLTLSEGAFATITGSLGGEVTSFLSIFRGDSSIFGDTWATVAGDDNTARFTTTANRTTLDRPDESVDVVIEFGPGPHPACF